MISLLARIHSYMQTHMSTTISACLQASFAVSIRCARTRLQRRPLQSFPPASPKNIHTLIHCTLCVLALPCHTKTHTHTLGDTRSLLCLRACGPLLQCPSHVQERDFRGGPCTHSPLPHQSTYTHSFTALFACLQASFAVSVRCARTRLQRRPLHLFPPATPKNIYTLVHYYLCVLALPCHTKTHTHTLGDTRSLLCLRVCRPLSQCPSHVQERDFRGGPCLHGSAYPP